MKFTLPSFVDTQGRLGNQMFQYAFGCRVAIENASRVYYDCSELGRYFALDEGLVSHDYLHACRLLARWMDRMHEQDVQHGLRHAPVGGCRYVGYFQGPHWFAGAESYVQRSFRFRITVEREVNRAKHKLIPSGEFACVAVRLGDYRSVSSGAYLLPAAWYREAIDRFVPTGMPVVVVSDEPEVVGTYLGLRETLSSSGELPLDFALIRDATVKVLSASSFSWWAAWLGESDRVVVPGNWLGWSKGIMTPAGVLPPEWTRLVVR